MLGWKARRKRAERDVYDALACAADSAAQLGVPDIFDFLAGVAAQDESYPEAARLFGAAAAIRGRSGEVRYQIYQADYEASVAALRDAMDPNVRLLSEGLGNKDIATRLSSHHARLRPTSPTSTPSWVSRRASNSPKRQHVTPEHDGADRDRPRPLKALVMAAMSKWSRHAAI